MKRIMVFLILAALLTPCLAAAEQSRVILCTYYLQSGWGDDVQAGWITRDGKAWTLEGRQGELGFPHKDLEILDFLPRCPEAVFVGDIDKNEFEDIESLVACVEAEHIETVGAANDAGQQNSYAVRYDGEGKAELILLGAAGDDAAENSDPTAQALYKALRVYFPRVVDYEGERIAPKGFNSVSLLEFCGQENADLANATVEVSELSCEEGPIPREITEKEAADFLAFIKTAKVVGKKNCMSVTGGTTLWSLAAPEGARIATFEFYKGALVRNDGMYYVSEG